MKEQYVKLGFEKATSLHLIIKLQTESQRNHFNRAQIKTI